MSKVATTTRARSSSKSGSLARARPVKVDGQDAGSAVAFSFGDPESVIDRRELTAFFEIWHNNRWYEPPLPLGKLAQAFNMSPHHRSAVALKVNLLVSQHQASRWLAAEPFERFALDFVQMGNGYFEGIPNRAMGLASIAHAPAMHTRRGVEDGEFWFVNGPIGKEHRFAAGTVFQLQQPDVAQEIYGLPEWLSALQSGLLAENATLYRRRYYLNGAHAGAVFYLTDPLADQKTVELMTEKLKSAKGVGNFKNMFVYIPNGKKDGLQILPIAEATAKDEFSSVKNVTRDDLLAAHRTPPQLIGIIPQNNGGFGKVSDARDAFFETEIVPIMRRMLRANDFFGMKVLSFRDYVCSDGSLITETGERVSAGVRR